MCQYMQRHVFGTRTGSILARQSQISAVSKHHTSHPRKLRTVIIWKNYLIPTGAAVIGNHWAIANDPEVFPQQHKFNQRWVGLMIQVMCTALISNFSLMVLAVGRTLPSLLYLRRQVHLTLKGKRVQQGSSRRRRRYWLANVKCGKAQSSVILVVWRLSAVMRSRSATE
ncbi:uncharacterized protein F5147DRAFT_657093 [Suillus discolor]|uniref:Uncharacterized protein n=1 Tax=Suillus discolor TaxID=1912936 RepID=A0A9P7JNR1_9AGAM|nr:uncharacterized protein F5147DRAFT_657093 [Suillus discolor]KAG2094611.1 hypothetical protein F5147DRAFT_657093 [Suillus discolor]